MTDVPFACRELLVALESAIYDAEQALLLVAERGQIFADCMDEHSENPPAPIVQMEAKADVIVDPAQDPLVAVCDRISAAKEKLSAVESRLRLLIG